MTRAQRAFLKEVSRWGGIGPDTETVIGAHGAAFEAVVRACERRGWSIWIEDGPKITPTGRKALDANCP